MLNWMPSLKTLVGEKKRAMVNLTVRVFGTLQQSFDHYDADKGMTVTVPDGTTVEGLIQILDLDAKQVGMVSQNGNLVPKDQEVEEGAELKIFQPISGG